MKFNDLLLNYGMVSVGYSVGRKIAIVKDATQTTYNFKGEKVQVPMLLTTKALITVWSGIAGVYLWPMYMYNDFARLEIRTRGFKMEDYNYNRPRDIVDYIMA